MALAFVLASCDSACGAPGGPSPEEPHASAAAAQEAEPSSSASMLRWSRPIDVATGPAIAGPWRMNRSRFHYVDDATVAVHAGGSVFVAWADNQRQQIYFRAYDADGGPRGDPVRISRSPGVFSWLPRMRTRGDHVYVLWQEIVFSGGTHGGEAFFARSADRGRTFEAPQNLSQTTAGCGKGRLTEERWDNGSLDLALGRDGTLFAAWTEYEGPLRLSRSTDRGATFSEPVHVAGNDRRPARAPSLAVAGDGAPYVAWAVGEDDEADIQLARSEDGGRSFERLGAVHATDGHSDAPKIAFDGEGVLHLAHGESADGMFGRYHVRHLRLDRAGEPLGAPRVLSATKRGTRAAHFPSLAVDGDAVYVVWEHYPSHRERPRGLGFALSTDRGQTFAPPSPVPGMGEGLPGHNGSLQGLLARKLDVDGDGSVAIVNSTFDPGKTSRIRLVRANRAAR